MPDLPTRAQIFNIFADEILIRAEAQPAGARLTPEEIFTEGSDINLIGAGASAMGEEILRQLARSISDLTLDGARGEALDRLVADRYSPTVVRKTATPARVSLAFSRPDASAGAFTFAAGSRVESAGGVQFELTTSAAFSAAALGPITADARAVDAGAGGNVAAYTITGFITVPSDPSVTVANPSPASGGDATETDASLRGRARAFYGAARRGTLAAIEFGALTVPGVRQATAEEVIAGGAPTGVVQLFIADAHGQANALLVEEVRLALFDWRAAGIVVDIFGATPTEVLISLRLRFETNADPTLAFDAVRETIVARVNALRPNAILERSMLFEAARSVDGVIVLDDAIVAPPGDIVPVAGEIIRTRPDLVTAAP